MDCGLLGQSKVFAFCPVSFKLYRKGRFVRRRGRAATPRPAGAWALAGRCLVCFRSAQFEHTVLITSGGAQILTKLPHEAWGATQRSQRPGAFFLKLLKSSWRTLRRNRLTAGLTVTYLAPSSALGKRGGDWWPLRAQIRGPEVAVRLRKDGSWCLALLPNAGNASGRERGRPHLEDEGFLEMHSFLFPLSWLPE